MPSTNFKLLATGAVAGICNGFFGAGGGTLVVLALERFSDLDMQNHTQAKQAAHATALTIILPFAVVTLVLYAWRGMLNGDVFRQSLPVIVGSIPGGFLGGKLLPKLSGVWLHRIFALLMAAAALHLLFGS